MMDQPTGDGAALERDALTGLPGLEAARRRLDSWAAVGPSHGLLLALPRVAQVNLAHGRLAGDAMIARSADRLVRFAAAEFDGPWFAARVGGASFLLLAREPLTRERWELLGEGLADAISRPGPGEAAFPRPAPRIALLRGLPGEGAESLLNRLAETMAVLEQGGARRLLWGGGGLLKTGRGAAQLEADLLQAIERNEIEVLFQPQFALSGARGLTGAEALARWRHPRLGRIGGGALFALADRADFLQPLSAHVADVALASAREWPPHLRLSLNITSADLASAGFGARLLERVRASGFPAGRLTLEVTEQVLIGDIAAARIVLDQLAGAGLRLALDDFGAGFCNFRYLKLLPLHYLKLDRSMVDGIATDARDVAVLRGLVAMAGALGLEVVAEGIEDAAQERVAAEEGCATMQGFLRGRPMTADEFLTLARDQAAP